MTHPTRDTAAGRSYLNLRQLGRQSNRDTGELLALYALEGFLDRLAVSDGAADLVLKGGVLLGAYDSLRPTRDVDLQATDLANDTATVLARVRGRPARPPRPSATTTITPGSGSAWAARWPQLDCGSTSTST